MRDAPFALAFTALLLLAVLPFAAPVAGQTTPPPTATPSDWTPQPTPIATHISCGPGCAWPTPTREPEPTPTPGIDTSGPGQPWYPMPHRVFLPVVGWASR